MVLQCYTWILHIFKQIIGDSYNDNQWQRLISSSGCGSHKSRERPQILRYSSSSGLRISIIDGKSADEWEVRDFEFYREAFFVSCCNGLTLFTLDTLTDQHIVVNPLSKEIIEIIQGPPQSRLCGFFFHPLAKEYRILSVHEIEADNYEYQLYVLGTKTWRKAANSYFNPSPTFSSICSRNSYNPAIVNNALHWDIGEKIMVFDMISEQFSIRCPPFEEANVDLYVMRQLLVKDDHLCFCYVGFEEAAMDVWVLEDYVEWSWIKKYVVNLDRGMIRYPMESGYNALWHSATGMKVISVQNNKLVLLWRHRGIFSYHLSSNTLEKIHLKKSDWLSESFEAYSATTSC